MTAIMRIDQVGLSAGIAGSARDDGLSGGELVTVTSTAHQGSFDVNLLWVGLHGVVDTNSRASLQKASPTSYTFQPTPGALGSWRIELVADRGTPNEDRQVRIFAIRDGGIRIPAANEVSDPEANLINSGSTYVARSEFNAGDNITDSPQQDATYVSHWRPVADLIHAFNQGAAPHVGRCGLRAFNGTQHNLAPGGGVSIDDIQTLIIQPPTDSSGVLTGIGQPTQDGNIYRLDLINQSTGSVLIKHLDAGSSLGNRITTPTAGDVVMAAGTIRTLYHTAYANFWNLV